MLFPNSKYEDFPELLKMSVSQPAVNSELMNERSNIYFYRRSNKKRLASIYT